jgi:hypothetical protein
VNQVHPPQLPPFFFNSTRKKKINQTAFQLEGCMLGAAIKAISSASPHGRRPEDHTFCPAKNCIERRVLACAGQCPNDAFSPIAGMDVPLHIMPRWQRTLGLLFGCETAFVAPASAFLPRLLSPVAALLKKDKLLSHCSEEILNGISSALQLHYYFDGEIIFSANAVEDTMIVVDSGRVDVIAGAARVASLD